MQGLTSHRSASKQQPPPLSPTDRPPSCPETASDRRLGSCAGLNLIHACPLGRVARPSSRAGMSSPDASRNRLTNTRAAPRVNSLLRPAANALVNGRPGRGDTVSPNCRHEVESQQIAVWGLLCRVQHAGQI